MKVDKDKIKKQVAEELGMDIKVVNKIWAHGWKSLTLCLYRGHDVRIKNVISIYQDKEFQIRKKEEKWERMINRYRPPLKA